MSIIIVGVGSDKFEAMNQLDGDDAPLYSATLKRYVSSDIV